MEKKTIGIIILSVFATLCGVVMVFLNATSDKTPDRIETTVKVTTNETTVEEPEENEEFTTEAAIEVAEEDEEFTTEAAVDVPEKDEDPYGMYEVTKEWLAEQNGGWVVERNNKIYSFSGLVMGDAPEKYGVGYETGSRAYLCSFLYLYDYVFNDVSTELTADAAISCGDFPVLKVSKSSDEIRLYADGQVPDSVSLRKAEFFGYTIPASHRGESHQYAPILDHVNSSEFANRIHDPSLCDMNDNPVADVYNLEYGKDYKYGYFEGTSYSELVLKADSSCYAIGDYIVVPTSLTKNGYAVMDISELELGYYLINNFLIFEITE